MFESVECAVFVRCGSARLQGAKHTDISMLSRAGLGTSPRADQKLSAERFRDLQDEDPRVMDLPFVACCGLALCFVRFVWVV